MPYYFNSYLLVSTNWIFFCYFKGNKPWIFFYFKENKPQTVQRCIFYAICLRVALLEMKQNNNHSYIVRLQD